MLILNLSHNKIVEIYELNFQKSTLLHDLNLSHNYIAKIAPKSFVKLLMLKSLDLSNNKLETFSQDLFGGSLFTGNKLRKLDLSYNQLTALKGSLFALFVNLAILDLSNVSLTFRLRFDSSI